MKTIIVTTDFSASAANALDYACQFAKDYNLNILLAHIYTIPGSYAAEGLSLVTIDNALDLHREKLEEELERVKSKYNDIHISTEMITGDFLEALQELENGQHAALIIMGTEKGYAELWQWGNDWLDVLTTIACPVLVIPQHIVYSPIMNIAFASDNTKACLPEQTNAIKNLVTGSNANFYIVHVTPISNQGEEDANRELYNEVFGDINPQYYTVENKSVIKGLAEFIQQFYIDLLIVIPHKHGLWHSFLNKSYTKQLALLNHLPVMAIHEYEITNNQL